MCSENRPEVTAEIDFRAGPHARAKIVRDWGLKERLLSRFGKHILTWRADGKHKNNYFERSRYFAVASCRSWKIG